MNLNPNEMINSITKFEASDHMPIQLSNSFLKEKLRNANNNPNIINLARGEGRPQVLNDIGFHPEILFDWGVKSMHSFLDDRRRDTRNLYDPEFVDKQEIVKLASKYSELYLKKNKKHSQLGNMQENKIRLDELGRKIQTVNDHDRLLEIKFVILYAMHTLGDCSHKNDTPIISCSEGINRYNVAYRFGNYLKNKYFVILDNWVRCDQEGISFTRTDYVINLLHECGLNWFPDINNEIMLKYAIFPHNLVGYYLIERGQVVKYVVNRHYIEEWEKDASFEIGDDIYIEQNIDFNILGTYSTIYQFDNFRFSIAARRQFNRYW